MNKYECIKDVFVDDYDFLAFTKGDIYEKSGEYFLKNNKGNYHYIPPEILDEHFKQVKGDKDV